MAVDHDIAYVFKRSGKSWLRHYDNFKSNKHFGPSTRFYNNTYKYVSALKVKELHKNLYPLQFSPGKWMEMTWIGDKKN